MSGYFESTQIIPEELAGKISYLQYALKNGGMHNQNLKDVVSEMKNDISQEGICLHIGIKYPNAGTYEVGLIQKALVALKEEARIMLQKPPKNIYNESYKEKIWAMVMMVYTFKGMNPERLQCVDVKMSFEHRDYLRHCITPSWEITKGDIDRIKYATCEQEIVALAELAKDFCEEKTAEDAAQEAHRRSLQKAAEEGEKRRKELDQQQKEAAKLTEICQTLGEQDDLTDDAVADQAAIERELEDRKKGGRKKRN